MKHPVFLPLRLLAWLPLSFTALAAEPPEASSAPTPTELGDIVVTANPLGRAADDLVQPVDVLHGAALARKRRASIGETLEGEPGVASSDFGPGVGRPVIRGQGGARVQVLENGIGSMDVSTISADHAVGIDPASAEQVEIIKGPATLMFGSGSAAGVVNVVNQRLPEQYEDGSFGEFELSFADNASERQWRGEFEHGVDGFLLHLDGAGRDAGDFNIPGAAGADGSGSRGTLANSRVQSSSGAVSLSHFGERGNLGLAYSTFQTRYGLPKESAAFIDLEQDRIDLLGKRLDPLPGLESIKLRLGHNDYRHTEFEDAATPGTRFSNGELEARVEAVHAPLAGWRGVAGLQVIDRDFAAIGEEAFVQPVRTRSWGLFLVEERPFALGRFEAGVRVEQQNSTPAARRPADGGANVDPRTGLPQPRVEHTPLSAALGTVLDLDAQHHLRVSLTHAERAPAAEELYAFGPHLASGTFERGDSRFGLERGNGLELGLERHGERWLWAVALYYNQYADYIFQQAVDANRNADGSSGGDADGMADGAPDQVDPDGNFVAPATVPTLPEEEREELLLLVDNRQGDARFYGLEAQTGYRLLTGALPLTARLFGDLVRGELDDGTPLPRVTPARYGFGFDGRTPQWDYALALTRVAEQDRVSALETPTAGYTLLSADLGYTQRLAALAVTWSLRGRNLLDEEARRHTSFLKDVAPLPGRSLIAGVQLAF